MAGPVENNGIQALTNRGEWGIQGREIQGQFPVDNAIIINDFEATGYGVLALDDSQVSFWVGDQDQREENCAHIEALAQVSFADKSPVPGERRAEVA